MLRFKMWCRNDNTSNRSTLVITAGKQVDLVFHVFVVK